MKHFQSLTQLISAYTKSVNTGDKQKDMSFDDVRDCVCETVLRTAMLMKFGITITQKSATIIRNFGYVEN